MIKVYYAGKINKNDWRHILYKNLRGANSPIINDNLIYNGPFFISCDHGCYHGENSHGVGTNKDVCEIEMNKSKTEAFINCINYINDSDIVFAYINSMDCYGTIAEIGYAYSERKEIYIAVDSKLKNKINDLWFVLQMANKMTVNNDIVEAHNEFKKWLGGK